jgi:hypothetical protein
MKLFEQNPFVVQVIMCLCGQNKPKSDHELWNRTSISGQRGLVTASTLRGPFLMASNPLPGTLPKYVSFEQLSYILEINTMFMGQTKNADGLWTAA